jgi:hypothetical protein
VSRNVSTCKIDLFLHMMFNLRFFVVFTSHWKLQVECLFSQLAHVWWLIAIRQSFVKCLWAHCSHFFEFLHVLLTWSYRWHLKHCFIRHSFSKLDWPQGWVSNMSDSPTRFNPRVEQKILFDESNRVLAIIRRSNPIREIVRNLRLNKIR